jgi:hypothetical protein
VAVTPDPTAQQFEVLLGLQFVQLESLQTYNFIVSPASGSEAVEVKVTAEPPFWGSGESETEVIEGAELKEKFSIRVA